MSLDPSPRRSASDHARPTGGPLTLRGGGWNARARAWRSDATLAHLLSYEQTPPVSASVLRAWLRELHEHGFQRVRTGALNAGSRVAYEAIGFHVVQTLSLLRADLSRREVRRQHRPLPRDVSVRRFAPRDLESLSAVDRTAFGDGWFLDPEAIQEASTATTTYRIRVAVDRTGSPIGYALSGRTGKSAFLQRLAVDPAHHRQGVAGALVVDSLRWAIRWRATTMVVNTQVDNHPALGLYTGVGFRELPDQLVVMERVLDTGT